MNKIKTVIGVIVLVLIAFTCVVYAQGPDRTGPMRMHNAGPSKGGMHMGPGFEMKFWENEKIREDLQLSEDQVATLEKISNVAKEEYIELRAKTEKAHLRMEQALKADTIDRKAVLKDAEGISVLRSQMFISKIETMLDIKEVLTADQVEQLEALRSKCGPPPAKSRGGRGFDRPPND